jgi:Predicted membrane protein (DUF2142)
VVCPASFNLAAHRIGKNVNTTDSNPTAVFSATREQKIIFLFCLVAAVHVFIFSAAFPFFSAVDEQDHFDLAVRYSQADPPCTLTNICDEAVPYIVILSSSEYLLTPESQLGGKFAPPPWTLPPGQMAMRLAPREKYWRETVKNSEASQPPLYYAIAGAWWRLCRASGQHDGMLLYLLRFLNVFFVAVMVWLGWFTAKIIFPENQFIRFAVPAFIAILPQTAFYAINNDILSPLTFGIVFVLLLKFWNAEKLSPRLAIAIGMAMAATFLTKISNLPLLAVAGTFLALKILRLAQNKNLRPSVPSLAILLVCAGLPMAAWMAWCRHNFGDFTGSMLKIQSLGWTHKPFAGWFHHPIFTAQGVWYFLKGNLSSFWQGELLWQGRPLAIPVVNLFYALLSISLLALAFFSLVRPRQFTPPQLAALWFGFACFASAFAFFALLSVKYDFHDCIYPSRERPFFISGRLMLGMLIPFVVLFVSGLDRALKKFGSATKLIVLAALLAFMLAAEITIDWPVFPNAYNWFHM